MNKRQLRQLHRYTGIIAAFFALLLACTGILLNHTGNLKLHDVKLRNPLLLDWYGIHAPAITSFIIDGNTISSDNVDVFFNTQKISACPSLTGAIQTPQMLVVSCTSHLLLLTQDGQLIESLDETTGLPTPVNALAWHDNQVYLAVDNGFYLANLDSLEFTASLSTPALHASISRHKATPEAISHAILQQSTAYSIDLERVLLDVHSGRIFGTAGVVMIDIAGVLLALLAISGLWIWWRK